MMDFMSEGVDRWEFWISLIWIRVWAWGEFKKLRIDVMYSPGRRVADLTTRRIGEMDARLKRMEDKSDGV